MLKNKLIMKNKTNFTSPYLIPLSLKIGVRGKVESWGGFK